MTPLDRLVRDHIQKHGPVDMAYLMQMALQHPQHGYYVGRDPLGLSGDFITAPEISQMFGEMIGVWCVDTWQALGRPDPFVLLELGPGRGTLMQDALRAVRKVEDFSAAARLYLLETSPVLRASQAERLDLYKPTWISDLADLPDLPVIVVANEFFDALPVRQYFCGPEGWYERKVGLQGDELLFVEGQTSFVPPDEIRRCYEFAPDVVALMNVLVSKIAARGGAGLVIDYGYTALPDAPTLQAVEKHRSVDPLKRLGEADLTAHVDFSLLARCAEAKGLKIFGPTGQGRFLEALGIGVRAAALKRARPDYAQDLDQALARLTQEDQMGELFKAMGFAVSLKDMAGFE